MKESLFNAKLIEIAQAVVDFNNDKKNPEKNQKHKSQRLNKQEKKIRLTNYAGFRELLTKLVECKFYLKKNAVNKTKRCS